MADGLTSFRPLSFFVAHDASVINGAPRCGCLDGREQVWRLGDAGQQRQHAAIDVGTGAAPIKLRFLKNNTNAIQQLNAAGNGAYRRATRCEQRDSVRCAARVHGPCVSARTSCLCSRRPPTTTTARLR